MFGSIKKRLSRFWRIITEAESVISIVGAVGVLGATIGPIATASWAYIEGSPWPVVITIFFLSIAALNIVLINSVIFLEGRREKRAVDLREMYLSFVADDENEILDLKLGFERALNDIRKAIERFNKGMRRIGRKARWYTFRLKFARTTEGQHAVLTLAANSILETASDFREEVEFLNRVNPALKKNYLSYIQKIELKSEHEKDQLLEMVSVVAGALKELPNVYAALDGFRNSNKNLQGIAKVLTGASKQIGNRVLEFRKQMKTLENTCKEMVAQSEKKVR